MLRIAFPTNKKMSYLSKLESNFEDSEYLTVLDLKGQNISDVQIIRNPHPHCNEDILNECRNEKFGVLILPHEEELPLEDLKKNGVSVFISDSNKTVLDAYRDFIQDRLVRA